MASLNGEILNKSNGAGSDYKMKNQSSDYQLEKMAQSAGERIGTMAADLASSTTDSVKSSREYVVKNPVKGVAIAAAAGIVTGSLLTMIFRGRRE